MQEYIIMTLWIILSHDSTNITVMFTSCDYNLVIHLLLVKLSNMVLQVPLQYINSPLDMILLSVYRPHITPLDTLDSK